VTGVVDARAVARRSPPRAPTRCGRGGDASSAMHGPRQHARQARARRCTPPPPHSFCGVDAEGTAHGPASWMRATWPSHTPVPCRGRSLGCRVRLSIVPAHDARVRRQPRDKGALLWCVACP